MFLSPKGAGIGLAEHSLPDADPRAFRIITEVHRRFPFLQYGELSHLHAGFFKRSLPSVR